MVLIGIGLILCALGWYVIGGFFVIGGILSIVH